MAPSPRPATVDDLYAYKKKAELVGGRLVIMEPTGLDPNRAALTIAISLRDYERRTRSGYAIGDNLGFLVQLPNRQSFSPDAAFYTGEPSGMKFVEGAPLFAVEVRSEGDYSPRAEREMAAKRADYFLAGTQVVWDVDLLGPDTVRVYRWTKPGAPTVFRRGETAEAEPALPAWRFAVDDLFD